MSRYAKNASLSLSRYAMGTFWHFAISVIGVAGAIGAAACGDGKTGDVGGESHWAKGWLSGCVADEECADGFSCIGHVCSIGCSSNATCEAAGGVGECIQVGDAFACGTSARASCSSGSTTCDASHEGWYCYAGAQANCERPIEVCRAGAWVAGSIDECRDRASVASPAVGDGPETLEVHYGDAPVALDVLFVVDNSSSMTAEVDALTRAVPGFLETLGTHVDAATRIAATTVDAQCAVNDTTVFAANGLFNSRAAGTYPPVSQFEIKAACDVDADCDALVCDTLGVCDDPPGMWACRSAILGCAENPNGSLNSSCRRQCTTDGDCQHALGDARYICQKPSGNEDDWGCVLPPMTSDCPDTTGPVLEGADLAKAHCITTMSVNQEKCLKYEEGLEASRLALDPTGPQAAQATAFHRTDAILVVIYISDEDDCSSATELGEEQFAGCGLLASTDAGGPLTPVQDYVDFLKGLKPAGRVMAMAVVGQSLQTDPAAVAADTEAYLASKGGERTCNAMTYLCAGKGGAGSADWGRRYVQLVDGFGPDGEAANLCAIEALPASFQGLAAKIARNAKRLCLPRPATEDGALDLHVTLVHEGARTALVEGTGPNGYEVVSGVSECASGRAVSPISRVAPGDRLELTGHFAAE